MMAKLFLLLFLCGSLICVSFAMPSEYSILSHDHQLDKFSSSEEEGVFQLFQKWQKEHGRVYRNLEEKNSRFQIFQRNLKYINEVNAKRTSPLQHRLGLNKFADMSPEEFKNMFLKELEMPSNWGNTMVKEKEPSENVPASVDWRDKGAVTYVRDQGNCASHWAFSVTGAIEGINQIVTGNLLNLSAQELVDCDPASHGCAGGYYFNAFGWVINNGGIDTEDDYPYTAENGTCKENAKKAVSIDNLLVLDGSEEALLSRTSQQPVSVSIDSTGLQLYTGGIYAGDNCSKNSTYTDLAVLIVGYNSEDGEDYWIVKNSWGQHWGEKGYLKIKRNAGWPYGVCAINFAAGYPVKEASSSLAT